MKMTINIINQNCQDIKNNICYVDSLLTHECNIMFVTECNTLRQRTNWRDLYFGRLIMTDIVLFVEPVMIM